MAKKATKRPTEKTKTTSCIHVHIDCEDDKTTESVEQIFKGLNKVFIGKKGETKFKIVKAKNMAAIVVTDYKDGAKRIIDSKLEDMVLIRIVDDRRKAEFESYEDRALQYYKVPEFVLAMTILRLNICELINQRCPDGD